MLQLTPVSRGTIRPGVRLPGALRDGRGRIVLKAGTTLTEQQVQLLHASRIDDLYAGPDWDTTQALVYDRPFVSSTPVEEGESADSRNDSEPESMISTPEQEGTINVSALRPDMRLTQDLYDQSDVLLLAAGMRVTARLLELLQDRSIHTLRVAPSNSGPTKPARLPNTRQPAAAPTPMTLARKLDELLLRELMVRPNLQPVAAWRRPRLELESLRVEADEGVKKHAAASETMSRLGDTLQYGGHLGVTHFQDAIQDFADMVTLDFDLLPLIVSMQQTGDDYLFDHCVNVALISMSVAAQLGLHQSQIIEIGLAGLLQDIGMIRVPGLIRLAPRKLTVEETNQVRRHPIHALEMLEKVRGLPPTVRIVVHQAHERADGSGYPLGRAGDKIHPFSTIVSIADVYSAMTRPRPYRSAVPPYEAARTILMEASQDRFDRAIVRAFLDSIALCPIGSIVELNDGRRAKVIRANTGQHVRPMVEQLDCEGRPSNFIIDLSKETHFKIIRAHP